MRNPVGAIFCGHISNDFTTATIIEVDIDIWQRNTFRVQEALKNQSVLNWVKIRDSHRPGNYRPSCRSTTGPNSNAIVSSPGDEVGDYKEVTGKTHSNNNFDLKLGLVLVSLRNLSGETLGQPNLNLLGKPTCLGFTFRNRKSWHQLSLFEGDFRTFRDQQGVVASFGMIGEESAHFGSRLHKKLLRVELEPFGIVKGGRRLQAKQCLLRFRIGCMSVVQVISSQKWNRELAGNLKQLRGGSALDANAVLHQFDEIVSLAKNLLHLPGNALGFVILTNSKPSLYFSRHASGGSNQTLRVGV